MAALDMSVWWVTETSDVRRLQSNKAEEQVTQCGTRASGPRCHLYQHARFIPKKPQAEAGRSLPTVPGR